METVVSGIRSTGNLHLGNYFGALKNFLRMQNEHNCYFFIADLHSLTTHPHPADLHQSVHNVLVEYLAAGLDPEKCTLYIQSDVPEISELYLILNMNAYKGELERVPSFKEKVRTQPNNVNAGLLTYPVLMTADIIIHKATKVPVGKDQESHLEMARNLGNRFNNMYGVEYFPEPYAYNFGEELVKVPGLDGKGKMSKSAGEHTAIFLTDEEDAIIKKMKRAVTDMSPTEANSPKPESIQNLFDLMGLVSSSETIAHFESTWNDCSIRYGDMKMQIAADMNTFIAPIRERIKEVREDKAFIAKAVKLGEEKARASAAKTVSEVKEIIGFRKFY
ncbi:MAG: tryptophan--tRNA ligase [Bacteroidota bacterium]|nr:tryptophan--tRNA ligase [Bacteroidota bacterium]MDX5430802.1 tryptophan--tRNA ligase [Bacteroidota bacterium]MDX5469547.1 tryptophan--tRNA ligase [Bacteroidota bacterium]